jgi:hypothetical protein
MDKIIEEMLKSIIMRIEKLEEIQKPKKPIWKTNPHKQATERQIIAVQRMGGKVWEGMTQGDIEKQFQLINQRDSVQKIKPQIIDIENKEKLEEIRNKLTQEEIDEIGEEAFL